MVKNNYKLSLFNDTRSNRLK